MVGKYALECCSGRILHIYPEVQILWLAVNRVVRDGSEDFSSFECLALSLLACGVAGLASLAFEICFLMSTYRSWFGLAFSESMGHS